MLHNKKNSHKISHFSQKWAPKNKTWIDSYNKRQIIKISYMEKEIFALEFLYLVFLNGIFDNQQKTLSGVTTTVTT